MYCSLVVSRMLLKGTQNIPKLFLTIPGLAPGLDLPEVGISDSKLVMTT